MTVNWYDVWKYALYCAVGLSIVDNELDLWVWKRISQKIMAGAHWETRNYLKYQMKMQTNIYDAILRRCLSLSYYVYLCFPRLSFIIIIIMK